MADGHYGRDPHRKKADENLEIIKARKAVLDHNYEAERKRLYAESALRSVGLTGEFDYYIGVVTVFYADRRVEMDAAKDAVYKIWPEIGGGLDLHPVNAIPLSDRSSYFQTKNLD